MYRRKKQKFSLKPYTHRYEEHQKSTRKRNIFFGLVALFMGIMIIYMGFSTTISNQNALDEWELLDQNGKRQEVTFTLDSYTHRSGTNYFVEYAYADYRHQEKISSETYKRLQDQQIIEIYYLPDKPYIARATVSRSQYISNPFVNRVLFMSAFLCGVLLLILGLIFLLQIFYTDSYPRLIR